MVVLPEEQKGAVANFFSEDLPSKVWLDGYLQNRVPGITYVDHEQSPTFCIVVTEFHHIAFVGWRGPFRDFSRELAEVLAEEVYLGLVWPETMTVIPPAENLVGRLGRYEFRSSAPTWEPPGVEHAAEGLSFSPMDENNFAECASRGECVYAYETAARFLKECFGVFARRDGKYVGNAEVICQSTDHEGRLRGDVQIIVAEEVRRQGLGTSLARHLLTKMVSLGIHPVWSCNQDNVASSGLAKRLGFSDPTVFEILNYRREPGLQSYWVGVLDELVTTYDNRVQTVRKLQERFQFNRLDAHWLVVTYLREKETRGVSS